MGWSDRIQDKLESASGTTRDERDAAAGRAAHLQPVNFSPPLIQYNGCGVGLYGWLHDRRLRQGFVKLYFVTFLWIPLVPLMAYVVSRSGDQFQFFNRVSLLGLIRAYRWRVFGLYFTALLEGVGGVIAILVAAVIVLGGVFWLIDNF